MVLLENGDLEQYQALLDQLEAELETVNQSARPDSRISLARGIAIYNSETDLVFANVFKRADDAMYKNKAAMKQARMESKEIEK